MWGVGVDYDNATARTLGSGQTLVDSYFSPSGDTYWVQRRDALTPAAGTAVTLDDTAPTTDRWNLSAMEITPPVADLRLTDLRSLPQAVEQRVGFGRCFLTSR